MHCYSICACQNCFSDPGWLQPRTIYPQHRIIGDDPTTAFDAAQPVESQMVHYNNLTEDNVGGSNANFRNVITKSTNFALQRGHFT